MYKTEWYNTMKRLLKLIIMTLLCMMAASCNSKFNMAGKEQKFNWMPTVAAPYNYPIEIKYAFVGYGSEGKEYPVMDRTVHKGLGVPGDAVSLAEFSDTTGQELPNSIDVLWLSYCEAKYYEAKVKLPQALQDRMAELFRNKLYMSTDEEYISYEDVVLTLLPGGHIWLYLVANGRCDLLCDTIQAHEVKMSLKQFDRDAANFAKDTKDYCEGALDSTVYENLQTNGIPTGLWETYSERFYYDIRMEFEDERAKLKSAGSLYGFANGEYCYEGDGYPIDKKARLSELVFDWNIGDTLYTAFFYFNEQEVIDVYRKAFGANGLLPGELVVKVSKYNNRFDNFLREKDREYPLTKTMIHAFRVAPKDRIQDVVPYYNNHEEIHSDDIRFIGG